MLRSLVCVAAIFFLLVSVCLIPQNALARRCPVKMPETLLSLYQNSDSIYIAAFDRLEDGKVIEDTEDYTAIERKKHFIISTTLKGEAQKFFVLEDVEYRHKAVPDEVADGAEEPEAAGEQEETETDSEAKTETEETKTETFTVVDDDVESVSVEPELAAGDTVLLFVRKGSDDEREAPQLTDFRDGLKRLDAERLAAYEKRILELNGIFAEKKINHDRILEWLIRCAQDPLTRWEGTYELLSGVQQLEWRTQAEERRRERIANGEPVEVEAVEAAVGEEDLPVQGRRKNIDTTIFAKTIDENQKFLLANILLDRSGEKANKERSAVRGDRELIELIKRWGDPRLLNYLLDSLRGGADEPYYKAESMNTIAELLDDDEAASIAEKYQETAWENDSDVVGEDSEEEETAEVKETEPEAEQRPADTGTPPETEGKTLPEPEAEEPEAVETPAVKKQTYKELRDELMQKFLAQCDKVIADREREKSAETAR